MSTANHASEEIRVLFAPDWREGCPYQGFLSDHLEQLGVSVEYLFGYRRVLPLYRGVKHLPQDVILHLHWPDRYLGDPNSSLSALRIARFPYDLKLATRGRPFVATAHNLYPHNRPQTRLLKRAVRTFYQRADQIVAHTEGSIQALVETFDVREKKIRLIPHGPSDEQSIKPIPQAEARENLKLDPKRPLCLMPGVVSPYKGIDEVIAFWKSQSPDCDLAIVGKPSSAEYGESLQQLATGNDAITLRLEFVSDEELRDWHSAADCCLFNYKTILTSGSIMLPRHWGLPILLPNRLTTLELGEPDPRVFRYESVQTNLAEVLTKTLSIPSDYEAAQDWRESNSWTRSAQLHRDLYRELLSEK